MNIFPLSLATKEAIKVALSIVLALTLAMAFGWNKAYWAAIAVVAVAANETFGHSIRKARNRIVGTLCGAFYALTLISLFPQNPLLFIIFYTLFLGFCVFMSSHKKYGYAFTIAFVVCAIICCSSGFENQAVFNVTLLRIEETILGITIFSLVFHCIWPNNTEQVFFSQYEGVVANLQQATIIINAAAEKNSDIDSSDSLFDNHQQLAQLQELLSLPLAGSFELQHQHQHWKNKVKACVAAQQQVDQLVALAKMKKHDAEYWELSRTLKNLTTFIENTGNDNNQSNFFDKHYQAIATKQKTQYSKYTKTLEQRTLTAVKAISIFVTCILLWIYVPIPGGYITPMIASAFSCTTANMPKNALKYIFFGVLACSLVFLAQYVFIMPRFTEFWQLALLYFINIFIIWRVCSSPQMVMHKMLAGNLAVVLPMGAMQLTPSYGIVTPLTMLMTIFMVLGVISFYSKLYNY